MRTDGQIDMTKLIATFRNFANAPKTSQNTLHMLCQLLRISAPLVQEKYQEEKACDKRHPYNNSNNNNNVIIIIIIRHSIFVIGSSRI